MTCMQLSNFHYLNREYYNILYLVGINPFLYFSIACKTNKHVSESDIYYNCILYNTIQLP